MEQQRKNITQSTAGQIRLFRQKQGLSQEQLALKADLNPAYLGQIERGLKCPTIETLYKITCALEITLPEFFAFDARRSAEGTTEQLKSMIAALPSGKADRFTAIIEELARLVQD